MKYLYLTILISYNSFGNCDKPVTFLNKDTPSPCSGFLFTPEAEKANRLSLIDADYNKQLADSYKLYNDLYKQENVLLTQQKDLWHNESTRLSKEVVDARSGSLLNPIVGFLLGTAVTILVTYSVNNR